MGDGIVVAAEQSGASAKLVFSILFPPALPKFPGASSSSQCRPALFGKSFNKKSYDLPVLFPNKAIFGLLGALAGAALTI